MRTRIRVFILCLVLYFAIRAFLSAATIEKVHFADSVQAGGATLPLHGVGLLRYKKVIKAYVAALYLNGQTDPKDVLSDVPKRLELEYFWAIKGPEFGKKANEILRSSFPPETLSPLKPRIDEIHARYRDVKPGDRYSLTYLPGTGTELALNRQKIVTIPGADFAKVYFAIWLGPESGNEALKNQLLTPYGGGK